MPAAAAIYPIGFMTARWAISRSLGTVFPGGPARGGGGSGSGCVAHRDGQATKILAHGGVVALQRDRGGALPAEILGVDRGGMPHVGARLGVVEELFERVRPVTGFVPLDQHPRPPVLDGAGEAADFRGEDGCP